MSNKKNKTHSNIKCYNEARENAYAVSNVQDKYYNSPNCENEDGFQNVGFEQWVPQKPKAIAIRYLYPQLLNYDYKSLP